MIKSILVIIRTSNLTEEARITAAQITETLSDLLEEYERSFQGPQTFKNKPVEDTKTKAEKTTKTTAKSPQETVEEVTSNDDGRKEGWTWATRKRGSKRICEGTHPTTAKNTLKMSKNSQKIRTPQEGKILNMAEGPEKKFAIYQSMREKPRVPVNKRIDSIIGEPQGNLKKSVDNCSFVTIRGISRQRYSKLKALMKALSINTSKIYAISWIGLSLVQFIVENEYISKLVEIICTPGIGFEYIENFNPFDTENYRRALGERENAKEISFNKFVTRAAKTSINSGNLTVTAKFMMLLPTEYRYVLRNKIMELSGAKPILQTPKNTAQTACGPELVPEESAMEQCA